VVVIDHDAFALRVGCDARDAAAEPRASGLRSGGHTARTWRGQDAVDHVRRGLIRPAGDVSRLTDVAWWLAVRPCVSGVRRGSAELGVDRGSGLSGQRLTLVDHLSGLDRHTGGDGGPAEGIAGAAEGAAVSGVVRLVGWIGAGLLSGEGPSATDRDALTGEGAGLLSREYDDGLALLPLQTAWLHGHDGLAGKPTLLTGKSARLTWKSARLAGDGDAGNRLDLVRLAGLVRVVEILLAGETLRIAVRAARPARRLAWLLRDWYLRAHARHTAIARAAALRHRSAALLVGAAAAGHGEGILDAGEGAVVLLLFAGFRRRAQLGIGQDAVLDVDQAPFVLAGHRIDIAMPQKAHVLEAFELLNIAGVALGFVYEKAFRKQSQALPRRY